MFDVKLRKPSFLSGKKSKSVGSGSSSLSKCHSKEDSHQQGSKYVDDEIAQSILSKFELLLNEDVVDIDRLRTMCWKGIPSSVRAKCWMMLAGYMPCNRERRKHDMEAKRQKYREYVQHYYNTASRINEDGSIDDRNASCVSEEEIAMRHQIHIDVPRTNPEIPLFHTRHIQQCMERILYVWSKRHPGSGYVQGLNDLATPFISVFCSSCLCLVDCNVDQIETQLQCCGEDILDTLEADSFWCFSNLLDHIQDNYISSQPVSIRLWDTYLAEGDRFPILHAYVCAAFLLHWSAKLLSCEYSDMMLLLQSLPANELTPADFEAIISKGYMWREWYETSPNHLRQQPTSSNSTGSSSIMSPQKN